MQLVRAPLVLLLLFIAASTAHAQRSGFWKFFERPDYGFGIHLYQFHHRDSLNADVAASKQGAVGLTSIIGANFPLFPLDSNMSVGINPQLEAGFILGGPAFGYAIEIPVIATWKYGTDASWKGSKFPLGATVGLGYQYSAFLGSDSYGFARPTMLVEINIGKRRGPIGLVKLRYTRSLASHVETIDYNDGLGPERFSIWSQAFYLAYVLNY